MKKLFTFIVLFFSSFLARGQYSEPEIILELSDSISHFIVEDIDLDGDGDAVYQTSSGEIYLLINDAAFSIPVPQLINFSSAYEMEFGEINNDGFPDLIFHETDTGPYHTLLNNGAGNFEETSVFLFESAENGQFGDFNGDGFVDFAFPYIIYDHLVYEREVDIVGSKYLKNVNGLFNSNPITLSSWFGLWGIHEDIISAEIIDAVDIDYDGKDEVLELNDRLATLSSQEMKHFLGSYFRHDDDIEHFGFDWWSPAFVEELEFDVNTIFHMPIDNSDINTLWYVTIDYLDNSGNPQKEFVFDSRFIEDYDILRSTPINLFVNYDNYGMADLLQFQNDTIFICSDFDEGEYLNAEILFEIPDIAFWVETEIDENIMRDVVMVSSNNTGSTIYWMENQLEAHSFSFLPFWDSNDDGEFSEEEIILNFDLSPIEVPYWISENQVFIVGDESINIDLDLSPIWTYSNEDPEYIFQKDIVENDSIFYFPLVPVVNLIKQDIEITSGITRCDRITKFWIDYTNCGTEITDGFVKLELDDSCSFVWADPPIDTIINDEPYWYYENFIPTESRQIIAYVQMPDFESLGDTLLFESVISTWDELAGDKDFHTSELICSYDPNDKLVEPVGIGENNYTLFEEDTLEYTIRFQNTGNDTAFNVVIRDTINFYLIFNSIDVIASSHSVKTFFDSEKRVVEFRFENILLPDSTTNILESEGFVKFRIACRSNLPENIQIKNTAGIFFDFNPAIVTNTVRNTMVRELPGFDDFNGLNNLDSNFEIKIIPNPMDNFTIVRFDNHDNKSYTMRLVFSTGKVVREISNVRGQGTRIQKDGLDSGLYIIELLDENGIIIGRQKLIVI